MPSPTPGPPQFATTTAPGLVSVVAQALGGAKTLVDVLAVNVSATGAVAGLFASSDDPTTTFSNAIYGSLSYTTTAVVPTGNGAGVYGELNYDGGSFIGSYLTGIDGQVYLSPTIANTISVGTGGYFFAKADGPGDITHLSGVRVASNLLGGGTVVNNYGLYIGDQAGVGTNNYQLFSDTLAPVVIMPTGRVGVGTSSPSEMLHVVGNILATGTISGTFSGAVTGTGVAGRLAYWTGASALSSDSELLWDATNNRLTPGTDNTGEIGTDALRWLRVRATTIVSGSSLVFDDNIRPTSDTTFSIRKADNVTNLLNLDTTNLRVSVSGTAFVNRDPKLYVNHAYGDLGVTPNNLTNGLEVKVSGNEPAGPGFTTVLASAYFEAEALGSPSLGILQGLYSTTVNSGTAALSVQRSVTVQTVQNSATSNLGGATNHAIGVYSESYIQAAGSMPNFRAFSMRAPIRTGAGTWTNHYGLYLEDNDITGVTNAWGVYQLGGTVRNYFAGNTGFGSGAAVPSTSSVIDISSSLVGGSLIRIQSTAAAGFGEISFRNSGGAVTMNIGQGNTSSPSPYTNKNYIQITTQDLIFTSGSTVIGSFTTLGNFFVDTNVLFVDSVSNRVGINTSTPTVALGVSGAVSATGLGTFDGGLNISGITTSAVRYAFTNSSGTPGNATINRPTGRVAIAAAASAVVVTNSVVTASSVITVTVETADATLGYLQVVPAAGSFTITNLVGAAATAVTGDVTVSFVVHTN